MAYDLTPDTSGSYDYLVDRIACETVGAEHAEIHDTITDTYGTCFSAFLKPAMHKRVAAIKPEDAAALGPDDLRFLLDHPGGFITSEEPRANYVAVTWYRTEQDLGKAWAQIVREIEEQRDNLEED